MPPLGDSLLQHLRLELREPALDYAEPPAPISGGYDTRIFGFRLAGAPEAFSIPLILRVFDRQHPPARALSERVVQNVVAELGYPAPRVLLANADATIIGGAFLVMERLPGRPLFAERRLGVASTLVATQLRLHALDADVLLEAFDRAGSPLGRELVTVEGFLARLERRIAQEKLSGLERAMRWLVEHRPADERRRVICHGDFHPLNILMAGGRVTGVIDWANTVVAHRALDVASTRVILRFIPVELMDVPPVLRGVVGLAARVLAARYVNGYRRRQRLDATRLAYYEALACIRALVRTAAARLAPVGESGLNPLDASLSGERLSAHFARIAGVTPALPPAPRA